MFISNNRASFHFWGKENLVKHQKVSKYYENDCRNEFQQKHFQGSFSKVDSLFIVDYPLFIYKVAKEKLYSSYPRRTRIPSTKGTQAEFSGND